MAACCRITYIGHATTLVELDGVRLLTDPVFRDRIGPLRRYSAPVDSAHYQGIDAVLLSHLHRDHLDAPSVRCLHRSTRFIVPRGAARLLQRWGFLDVTEVTAGDTVNVGAATIAATPANHDGARSPWGPRAEALGFMVQGSYHIYFAGDTDLFGAMAALSTALDVALLPVWGWGPTLGRGHLTPQRAAAALTLLRPSVAIPIHWGTFFPVGLGWTHGRWLTRPPHMFAQHAAAIAPEVMVRILYPGDRWHVPTANSGL